MVFCPNNLQLLVCFTVTCETLNGTAASAPSLGILRQWENPASVARFLAIQTSPLIFNPRLFSNENRFAMTSLNHEARSYVSVCHLFTFKVIFLTQASPSNT